MSIEKHSNVMLQSLNSFPVGCKVKIKKELEQTAIRYYDFTGKEEERAKMLVQQTFIVKGYTFFVLPSNFMDTRLVVQYDDGHDDLEYIDTWCIGHFEIVK